MIIALEDKDDFTAFLYLDAGTALYIGEMNILEGYLAVVSREYLEVHLRLEVGSADDRQVAVYRILFADDDVGAAVLGKQGQRYAVGRRPCG